MNRKSIRNKRNGNSKIICRRSIVIAPFLDNHLCAMLKCDLKLVDTDTSEFGGKFNRYIISLIRTDLKKRNII